MVGKRAILLACLLPFCAAPLASQPAPEVTHALSFPDVKQQYVNVHATFPVRGERVELRMPTWTPGSYQIREFSADVEGMVFTDAAGHALRGAKVDKNRWTVDVEGADAVVASYRVHAGELSVQSSWVSTEWVLLNGATLFLFSEASRGLPQRVSVEPPPGLRHVLSPLPEPTPGMFRARDFDELVDSPIVISDDLVHRFSQDGHEYRLINVGVGPLWDGPRSARDLQAIVAATNAFWGTVPLTQPYWFFNILAERGGGLEHDHGTVIMGSRWQMREREDYVKWLSLAAHEYFHAWNVRRMRPAALAEYNYETEQYTGSLWLVEGLTGYYDNLLLSRAKRVRPDEYFKRLAIDLHALETTPGRERISLRQASRDAWIRHYRPDPNTVNSTVSYYTKGAVLGFVLDTRLRSASDGELSLDDVLRAMYRRWVSQPYPEDAFIGVLGELGGAAQRDWLEQHLDSPAELDVDAALAWYGLQLDRHPANNAARETGKELLSGFGATWEPEPSGLVIATVLAGSSGSAAGLLPGDELLAVSGERITRDTLDDRMLRLRPGEDVELLIARRGRIISVPVRLQESIPATYEIGVMPDFGRRELRRLEAWLGQPLELAE